MHGCLERLRISEVSRANCNAVINGRAAEYCTGEEAAQAKGCNADCCRDPAAALTSGKITKTGTSTV